MFEISKLSTPLTLYVTAMLRTPSTPSPESSSSFRNIFRARDSVKNGEDAKGGGGGDRGGGGVGGGCGSGVAKEGKKMQNSKRAAISTLRKGSLASQIELSEGCTARSSVGLQVKLPEFGGGLHSHLNNEIEAMPEHVIHDDTSFNGHDLSAINDSGQDSKFYWRERLNATMESLWVNLVVMLLIFIDVGNVLYFLSNELDARTDANLSGDAPSDTSGEPPAQMFLTISVLSCFWVELWLRIIAQRRRFFKNWWNIFDLFVIAGSVIVASLKYTFQAMSEGEGGGLDAHYTSILRLVSRFAIAFRVTRVFLNLRKARKLSGFFTKTLRSAVSQNRRRYTKYGFDLDLTYITNRVTAMTSMLSAASSR
jgi:hypothetical protein